MSIAASPAWARLAELAERTMARPATLHDSVLTISSDRGSVSLEPQRWK